ncbi:MAG: HlyD family secretion protein [Rhodothermales bacterium]|jgi:HlyD family secretion protein
MKHVNYMVLAAGIALAGCGSDQQTSDAFGNFESTEVTVSSEVAGRLVHLNVTEGQRLEAGAAVGLVDTTQFALRRDELRARRAAVRARYPSVAAQEDVLRTQRVVASRELDRFENLVSEGAATSKTLDDLRGQIQVLDSQLATVRASNPPIAAELNVLDAQLASLEDQLGRARLVNPVSGVVLTTFASQSELTSPGRPLYRIAPLDTLELRAYVSGAQLPQVRLGEEVTVIVDADEVSNQTLTGTVSWVSSQAEFTPKFIQTKEERVSLVYAVKVRVANPDGVLKLGMPGEIRFAGTQE